MPELPEMCGVRLSMVMIWLGLKTLKTLLNLFFFLVFRHILNVFWIQFHFLSFFLYVVSYNFWFIYLFILNKVFSGLMCAVSLNVVYIWITLNTILVYKWEGQIDVDMKVSIKIEYFKFKCLTLSIFYT